MKFVVKFDLTFQSSDGENLVKFLGEDFSTCQESTKTFRGEFRGKLSEQNFGNFFSNNSRLFSETSFSRRAVPTHCTVCSCYEITSQERDGLVTRHLRVCVIQLVL